MKRELAVGDFVLVDGVGWGWLANKPADGSVKVVFPAGNCPHCGKPMDDETTELIAIEKITSINLE